MILTQKQQAILDGEKGEIQARAMKTLVKLGEIFGAEKLVPVTSEYNYLATSFGSDIFDPVYELMEHLIKHGAVSAEPSSADNCPMDKENNKPESVEAVSPSEASEVVCADRVLGARCNHSSPLLDMMASIVGYVPYFGLVTDEAKIKDLILEDATECITDDAEPERINMITGGAQ